MSTWLTNSNASETSYSIENNTSEVKINLIVSWNYTSWAGDYPAWYIKINGETKASGTANFNTSQNSSGSQTVVSRTFTVPHNADGSGAITWAVGYEAQHKGEGYETASGSLNLTTIPRATTPTLNYNSRALEQTVRITMTPASSNFAHKIYYSINNSGTKNLDVTTSTAGTRYYDWVIPSDLADYMPTSVSGTCNIVVETYSTNSFTTLIGTKSVPLTVTVPNTGEYITRNGTITYNEANPNVLNSGLSTSYYYKGKTQLNITVSATSGKGTAISGYSTTVTYTGASSSETFTTSSFTTTTIPANTTSISVSTTFTDARGRTSSPTTVTISNIQAYTAPSVTGLTRSSYTSLTFAGYSGTVKYGVESTWTPTISGSTGAKFTSEWYVRYGTYNGTNTGLTPTQVQQAIYTVNSFGNSAANALTYNILDLNLNINIYYQYGLKVSDGISTSNIYWLNDNSISTATSNIKLNATNSLCVKGIQTATTYNDHANANVANTTAGHFYKKIRASYGTDTLVEGVKEVYYLKDNTKISIPFSATFSSGSGYVDITFNNADSLTSGQSYTIYIVFQTNHLTYTKTGSITMTQCPSISLTSLSSNLSTINYYDWSALYFWIISYLNGNNDLAYDFNSSTGFRFYLNTMQIPSEIIGTPSYSDDKYNFSVTASSTFYPIATNPLGLDLNGANNVNLIVQATNLFGKVVGTASYSITLNFAKNPSASFRLNNSAYLCFKNNSSEQIIKSTSTLTDLLRESMELYFYVTFSSYNNKTHSVKIQIARMSSGVSPTSADWQDFYEGNSFNKTLPISASYNAPATTYDTIGPIIVREISKNYDYYFRIVIDNSIISGEVGPYYSLIHTNSGLDINKIDYASDTEILTIDLLNASTLGYDSTYASTYASNSVVSLVYGNDSNLSTGTSSIDTVIDSVSDYNQFIYTVNTQKTYSSFPSDWTHRYFQFLTESEITITYSNNVPITTRHTSYSSIALAYNQAPTVAYRPNYLGINNNISATDLSSVLAIHDYQNHNIIRLISAEQEATIGMLDGSMNNFIIDGGELN